MLEQAQDPALIVDIEAQTDSTADASERRICCAACGHPLTRETEQASITGAHQHQRMNPHGFEYDVRIFRSAPGCREVGQATIEHTWFAGYAWRVSLCGGCGEHVGWFFQAAGADRFHALISDRISLRT